MKKSLYILLAVTLCLLMLCAACGKDGTVDNNIDNTPDNIPVTGDDITPPDDSAGEDEYPTKTVAPYTIEIPQYTDELTKLNNRQALNAYAGFMDYFGEVTAFDLKTQTEMKFSILSGYVGNNEFQLVDFGYDGKLELLLMNKNSSQSYGVVFYEDGSIQKNYFCEKKGNPRRKENLCWHVGSYYDVTRYSRITLTKQEIL